MTEDLNSDDYYGVLGLTRDADAKAVKTAYKNLAKKYHPDLHQEDKAKYGDYFKKIGEAYEVLSNEEKRKQYDQFGKKGLDDQKMTFSRPEDLFAEIFGSFGFGNFGFNFGQPRDVFEYPIKVSYKNLYKGKTLKFKIARQHIFKGDQSISSQECLKCFDNCQLCQGRGFKLTTRQIGLGFLSQQKEVCTKCSGTGKILHKDYKFGQKEEIIQIDIKPGSFDGQRYILKEKGDMVPGLPIKDLHVILMEEPEPGRQRQGLDLYWEYEITLADALIGSSIIFDHYDGQKYNLTFQGPISPNDRRLISGLGFPDINSPARKGNLHLIFKVVFPKFIDDKMKSKLNQVFVPTQVNSKYPILKMV